MTQWQQSSTTKETIVGWWSRRRRLFLVARHNRFLSLNLLSFSHDESSLPMLFRFFSFPHSYYVVSYASEAFIRVVTCCPESRMLLAIDSRQVSKYKNMLIRSSRCDLSCAWAEAPCYRGSEDRCTSMWSFIYFRSRPCSDNVLLLIFSGENVNYTFVS